MPFYCDDATVAKSNFSPPYGIVSEVFFSSEKSQVEWYPSSHEDPYLILRSRSFLSLYSSPASQS